VKDGYFTLRLRVWGAENRRSLPWVGESDPYRIWLSEVILQQTRVEQGMPYYQRFLVAFPTVQDLAAATENAVFKLWEGLGYYSRARNLHKAAKEVAGSMEGLFPETWEGLRDLPGVGDYTAAAVASFAYGLPHAVVDGNVYRVLARFYDIDLPVPGTAAKKAFAERAQAILDPADPAAWNQAMMDFGALVCTPRQPACGTCPVADRCLALTAGTVQQRPVKVRKAPRRVRQFHYLVLRSGPDVWIRQRPEGDVWAGLWEFPLVETAPEDKPAKPRRRSKRPSAEGQGMLALEPVPEPLANPNLGRPWLEALGLEPAAWAYAGSTDEYRQALSHQDIRARFHHFKSAGRGKVAKSHGWQRIPATEIRTFAFPRVCTRYLAEAVSYV